MTDLALLTRRNASRWASVKLTRGPEFVPVARRLVAAKARYQAVEAKTGVPWFFIAVTHEREASQRWDRQLGQGDPLDRVSVHDPKGRGPFTGPHAWEDAAVDALVNCGPHAARNRDWSIGGLLCMIEQYNGTGYANRGVPSPYIWSGTNQYLSGKYVADHVYDPNVVDKQLGCAGLLLAMKQIDPSINLGGLVVAPEPPLPSPPPLPPVPSPTAKNATAGAIVAGGAVVVQQAHAHAWHWTELVGIGAGTLILAVLAWLLIHHLTKKETPP